MQTYLIAYELAGALSERARLASEIMRLGDSWARSLDTVWYVRAELTQGEIEARLAPLIAGEDGLVVHEIKAGGALVNTTARWFAGRGAVERGAMRTTKRPAADVVQLRPCEAGRRRAA